MGERATHQPRLIMPLRAGPQAAGTTCALPPASWTKPARCSSASLDRHGEKEARQSLATRSDESIQHRAAAATKRSKRSWVTSWNSLSFVTTSAGRYA